MNQNPEPQITTVGQSHQQRPILLHTFDRGSLPILLLGGVHGDESEGFLFIERLLHEIRREQFTIPEGIRLHIVPRINPDGCEVLRRTNQHNVDLNRNLPTKDWVGDFTTVRYFPGPAPGSEPETVATIRLIEELDPAVIFSLHSYENAMINFNGESEDLARAMSEKNGLPPKGDIGYPTPGSLGTYAGRERNLPTITLEVFRGQDPGEVWEIHNEALHTGLAYYLNHPLPGRKTT